MRNVVLTLLVFGVVVSGCSRNAVDETAIESTPEQILLDTAYDVEAEVPDYLLMTQKELWQVSEDARSILTGKYDRKLDELDKFDREYEDEVRLTGFFARQQLKRAWDLKMINACWNYDFFVQFADSSCEVGVGTEGSNVIFDPEECEPERELLTLVSNRGLEWVVNYLCEERQLHVKPRIDPRYEEDVLLVVNLTALQAVTCGISKDEARRMVQAVCSLHIVDELERSLGLKRWNPLLISPQLVQAHDPAIVARWLQEQEAEYEENAVSVDSWVEFRRTEIKKLEPELQELRARKAQEWTPELQARTEQVAKQLDEYRLDLEWDRQQSQEPTLRERYQMLFRP